MKNKFLWIVGGLTALGALMYYRKLENDRLPPHLRKDTDVYKTLSNKNGDLIIFKSQFWNGNKMYYTIYMTGSYVSTIVGSHKLGENNASFFGKDRNISIADVDYQSNVRFRFELYGNVFADFVVKNNSVVDLM